MALTIAHAARQMRVRPRAPHRARRATARRSRRTARRRAPPRCRASAPAPAAARCPAGRRGSRAPPPSRAASAAIARPQPDVVAGARQMHGRAPCPSCPIRARRCVCVMSPSRALACATSSRSARCRGDETGSRPRRCVAPMSTARRPGVSHSTTGSTIVATIDPSDTNRVRATTSANAAAAISRRHRRQHAEHAARGRDALAAAKPQPHRIDVTDHRRHARGDARSLRRRRAAPRPRPCAMSASITAIAVDSPPVRYTLVAPTLPLPTRRRSIPPARLCDEIADRQRAHGVTDQDGGNHCRRSLISGALTSPV